jgi:hypothetical protein
MCCDRLENKHTMSKEEMSKVELAKTENLTTYYDLFEK